MNKTLKVEIYFNQENDDIYAVFPSIDEGAGRVAGYAQEGQHHAVHTSYIKESRHITSDDLSKYPYLGEVSEGTFRILSDKQLFERRVISLMKELIHIYTYGNHDNVKLEFTNLHSLTNKMYECIDDMIKARR